MHFSEIMLIDKPSGITSFDVIRRLRKIYTQETGEKAPKLGHAGTLDPLATGLMVLGVGSGTKKLAELIKLDKEYVAEVLIGERRSTGDMEGEVLESVPVVGLAEADISTQVQRLVGSVTLPVSVYSAIKKDGVPMYKRARAAAKVGALVNDVPVREMTVYEAEIVGDIREQAGGVVVPVRFSVGSGTYIRSLAEELGNRLGYPATLYSLRRTKVGEFDIKDTQTLE